MKINERSLIEGLSYALDVAEKSYFSHSKHVAYLSFMIGKELEMSSDELLDLYYTALVHDIGVSGSYGVNHNIVGRDIVLKLPLKNEIATYVHYHHELYNGTGHFNLFGDEIPLISQIICLANTFDIKFRDLKELNIEAIKNIKHWIDENKALFNEKIMSVLLKLVDRECVLLDYFSHEFNNILARKVTLKGRDLDFDDVIVYAQAFSHIIDNRSPFTFRHSVGIAELATKITRDLGFEKEIQDKMYVAALLHDVGKLTISNDILDKPGKLNEVERFEINKHTYYTRWILEQIEGFEDITNYASNHHEKLNGKGYPLQLKGSEIGELERIMTVCDIYQALTEERPYRDTMPIEKVWSIIDSMVSKGELDGDLVEKIKDILVNDFDKIQEIDGANELNFKLCL